MFDTVRARRTWLSGARAMTQRRVAEAGDEFEIAVQLDPGMADAWLGLHAAKRQQSEALSAMVRHEQRFGEERTRHDIALWSVFQIGPLITHRLRTTQELWCAVVARHLELGELDLAESALERVSAQSDIGRYLRGRHALATDQPDRAIAWFRPVVDKGERFLQASACLMSGILLTDAGVVGPAKNYFTWLLGIDYLPASRVAAHYWLGVIARDTGRTGEAITHFHRAFALDPSYPGLRDAVQSTIPEPSATTAPPAAVDDQIMVPDDPPPTASTQAAPPVPADGPERGEDILAELNQQIGQKGIKEQVRLLLAQTRAQIERSKVGLGQQRMTKHFVFVGPPGTGKTTIARVIARLYKAMGVLEGGHVVEVDRAGLIGEYHGHTVARTTEVLDEAMGGVLFIDEAYALTTEGFHNGDPFGREAIDTILKRMEDDRDKLVVIAAGYPKPMERFLDSNPGLKSRFTARVEFVAYSVEELVEIATLMAQQAGDVLTAEARTALRKILADMEAGGEFGSDSFGNARFVRTLVEHAAEIRNLRLFGDDQLLDYDLESLTHITREDLQRAAE